ncbi:MULTISPECIES: lysozyme inhibitor LprI family protein [unclassified Anabaena]|uniref:lysozyme inhibitor LprI family protein n=1 Tax=unclassified Anabaena TaxID=2619674 RepID=UPI00082FA8A4|nr:MULTISPECIES: lysozyme inhibitor LprI family protein [unclassified Anabaena]
MKQLNLLLPICASLLTASSLLIPTATIAKPTVLARNPNCNNARTQAEINRCTQLSYQNADRKLNQVYQQLLPTLSGSRRRKLISAQQAWIKFRDNNCDYERSLYQGGSIAPSIYAGCLTEMTQQRTRQLQSYLQPDR